MKHTHDAKVDVNLDFHKEDVESVIDKVTESVITIIVVVTAAQVIKKYL